MRTGRLLFYEGWDLANSAAFSSPLWTSTATGATVNVQSAGGRLARTGSAGGYAEFCGAITTRVLTGNYDFELSTGLTISNVAAESYVGISIGNAIDGTGSVIDGVGVTIAPPNGLYLTRRDGGSETVISNPGFTPTTAAHKLKLRREGPYFAAKIWLATAAEPSEWLAAATEYAYRAGDYSSIVLGLFGGNTATAMNVTFDDLKIYELVPGRKRRASAAPATATPTAASATVTANNLSVGSTATAAAATVAANNFSVKSTSTAATVSLAASGLTSGDTPTAAATTVAANNLTASPAIAAVAATVSVAANVLVPTVAATATAAAATVAANALTPSPATTTTAAVATVAASNATGTDRTSTAASVSVAASGLTTTTPTTVDLDDAAVSVAASDLSGSRTPAAAAVTAAASNLSVQYTTTAAAATVAANSISAGATLDDAAVSVSASDLSTGHTPTSASVTVTGNNVGQTFAPVLDDAAVTATGSDFDAIILGAEPLGTGRTPTAATVTVAANADKQTFGPVADDAAVTVAASGLSKISNTIGTAAVTVAATTLGSSSILGAATVSTTAYATTPPSSLILPAATVVATPATPSTFNLLPTDRTVGTAVVSTAANTPGYTASTVAAAGVTATGYDPDIGERLPSAATITTVVGQLTVGQTFAVASLAVLTNNLTGSDRTLAAATVAVQGYDLYLTPTGSLGYATLDVAAYNLNALNSAGTAAVTGVANPLESTRTTTAANTTLTAAGLSTQDTAGYGTVATTAYDLARESPGQYALGYGTATIAGFNLLPLVAASTGLAAAALAASAFTYQNDTASGQADTTAEAAPLTATERTAASGVTIDITAYGLGQTAPAIGTTTVPVAAYGLSSGATLPVSFRSFVAANVRRNEIEADVQISPDVLVAVR